MPSAWAWILPVVRPQQRRRNAAGWNVTEIVGSWFPVRHLTEVDPRPTRLGTPKLSGRSTLMAEPMGCPLPTLVNGCHWLSPT